MRLLLFIITFSLIIYTHQQPRKAQQLFRPSWLNYIKNNNNVQQFIISNPISTYSVHFYINNSNKIITKQILISQQNIWKAIYEKQKDFQFTINSKGQEGIIKIDASKNAKINFKIKKADNKKVPLFLFLHLMNQKKALSQYNNGVVLYKNQINRQFVIFNKHKKYS